MVNFSKQFHKEPNGLFSDQKNTFKQVWACGWQECLYLPSTKSDQSFKTSIFSPTGKWFKKKKNQDVPQECISYIELLDEIFSKSFVHEIPPTPMYLY